MAEGSILTFCKTSKDGKSQREKERARCQCVLSGFCLGAPRFYIIETGISSKSTLLEIFPPFRRSFFFFFFSLPFVYVQSRKDLKTFPGYRRSSIT